MTINLDTTEPMNLEQLIAESLSMQTREAISWVDAREPYTDEPGFGWLARRMGYYTSITDRLEGRYVPLYENEFDLKAVRMAARLLRAELPVAEGQIQRLVEYTISSGFTWKIEHDSKDVAEYISKAVDRLMQNSQWSDLEAESFERELEDGEFAATIEQSEGDYCLETVEPDSITEPVNKRELESFYGYDYFVPSWTFGVLTQEGKSKPIGYHICRNESGSDWELYSESRFVHWKRNTSLRAKRGVSDFYRQHRWLRYGEKVLGNTANGAAIQAAIAYIVEHGPNTSNSQAQRLISGRVGTGSRVDPYTNETVRTRKISSGHVVDISHGSKYHASALGSNNSQIYLSVMESLFRLSGVIYAMPEHFMTGYAGNNNRASSETAESPFIQGRLKDGRKRAERLRRLIEQFARIVGSAKYSNWESLELGLSIQVQMPDIITRDIKATTDALAIQKAKGWVSDRQAMQLLGRDPDDTRAEILAERAQNIKDGLLDDKPRSVDPAADPEADDSQDGDTMSETQQRMLVGVMKKWSSYP